MPADYDPAEEAEQFLQSLPDDTEVPEGADTDDLEEYVHDQFKRYAQMSVALAETKRGVRKKLDVSETKVVETDIGEIDAPDRRVTIEGEVVETLDENTKQSGLIGDDSGVIRYVEFKGGDEQEMEVGETYRLTNVETSEYNGRYSVKILDDGSTIESIDADFDVPDEDPMEQDDEQLDMAPIVSVENGTGLRMYDPETGDTIESKGPDEEVDYGLQLIFRVDNGVEAPKVVMTQKDEKGIVTEFIEALTGETWTLDDAIEYARNNIGSDDPVKNHMKSIILGEWVAVTGVRIDDDEDADKTYFASEFEMLEGSVDPQEQAQALLDQLGGGEA